MSSSKTHTLPYGLDSFVKPDMALQNDTRICCELSAAIEPIIATSSVVSMSGFTKHLSPKGKPWIVLLLLVFLALSINKDSPLMF